MDNKEYVIKNFYDNTPPLCKCGCGKEVKFQRGIFIKYFSDHKNKMPASIESIKKGIDTKIKNGTLKPKIYLDKLGINDDKLLDYYNKFINFDMSLGNISKETLLDKRTIKKYWKEIGLINDINFFNSLIRKHQGYWSSNIIIPKRDDYEHVMSLLPDIFNFIKDTKNKNTLGEVIRIFDLKIKPNFLYKILTDEYGFMIDKMIKFHNSSSAEIEFYNVLKYYYGNKIQRQFKIDNKIYDYILGDKILIEYDGTYWHNSEYAIANDKIKDQIAIDNGYVIIRISDDKSRDIETLIKIKKIYEKIQVKKN